MKREELVKNKGYIVTKLQNELFRQVHEYLETNKKTQTQFAEELGVTKGYVSQILNGDFDFKLSKFVELSLAIGKIPQVSFIDAQDNLSNESGSNMQLYFLDNENTNQTDVAESIRDFGKPDGK
jgi:transcriptional regulator with XRE-family HTH domain